MNTRVHPPKNLLAATAPVEHLDGVEELESWAWYKRISRWAWKCRLSIKVVSPEFVSDQTDWYVLADRRYPNGDVDLVPAKERGVTHTFQHQYYNGSGEDGLPWRAGTICAKTPMFYLRKRAYDEEPFDPEKRLVWHLCRARQWLQDAANGTLVDKGDPFELPDYNCLTSPFTLAYCESPETFVGWRGRIGQHGVAFLGLLCKPKDTYVLLSLHDHENKAILEPTWNTYVREHILNVSLATWVLLPEPVVMRPWQAPMTWGELDEVVESQGVDHKRLMAELIWPFAWEGLHFMLLGVPVAKKVGGELCQVHWQGLKFPGVGDRCRADHRERVGPTLRWQRSQNWHPNETLNRGRFDPEIRDAKILLVGAGAIGSMVAEILVRGGAHSLTVIDPGKTEIGNLARHTFTMADVGAPKVEALVARLSSISPHVAVKGLCGTLEQFSELDMHAVCEHSIIVDCTGSDDVLFYMEEIAWSGVRTFCSISVGLQARRLYVLAARKATFPRAFFIRHVDKWQRKDGSEYDGGPLPRSGGIGCWHPAFPARIDDMWLFAATALKYMEGYIVSKRKDTRLGVFERRTQGCVFEGVRLVREESDNG